MLVTAHSWDSVEELYTSLNSHGWGHQQLLALVRYIKSTDLAQRLFAVTSLDTLIISNYSPFEMGHETLKILFDREKQLFIFNYFLEHTSQPQVHREYPAETGIEKFDQLIQWLNW